MNQLGHCWKCKLQIAGEFYNDGDVRYFKFKCPCGQKWCESPNPKSKGVPDGGTTKTDAPATESDGKSEADPKEEG